MLEGTKKLFPTDYNKFKEAMVNAAEEENLPVALQLNELKNFTLKDFEDTFTEFKRDTGLDITGSFFICQECGQLHTIIEVDYPQYEEPTLLQ